ncbi:MAG TPA: rhamnogalacturonan acetylesterase [Polyangia bacterium]|nr:rhamnogalacturonan acetylesterase [Polyangia bacterium]
MAVPLAGLGCGSNAGTADAGIETGAGGSASETGGAIGSGGSNAQGGATGTGGKMGTGGSTGGADATGGTGATGGNRAAGGTGGGSAGVVGTGGATGVGGMGGSAGSTGSGGTTGSGGSTGGSGTGGRGGAAGTNSGGTSGTGGSAGTTGAAGSAPSGYPTPTTSNRAVCMSVGQTTSPGGAKVCPGGGNGPACIECLFGGNTFDNTDVATSQGTMEAGNYAVTVTMGGSSAGQTQINAETNRILLAPVSTSAGESVSYSFVVNVRAKEGQPTENVSAGYPGLDLYFSGPTGSAPEVSAVGYALVNSATKPVMIYVASDSTACDQSDTDYAGWGQMLPEYFAPPAGIANYADSGESSGSFLNNSLEWGAVKAAMVTGDWVLIQFGHNDGSTTSATFQSNITQMVKDAKAKGATPVLVSPPARATFSGGTLTDQSSLHSADMQAVATAQNVAYIDLTAITTTWYNQLGSNGWQQYHALGTDKTHTNAAGAIKIAGFVTSAITTQNIGLSKYLRP